MPRYILLIFLLAASVGYGQAQSFTAGVFEQNLGATKLILNQDKSFELVNHPELHRVFLPCGPISDSGTWIRRKDTIILNPHLEPKTFVEYDFIESVQTGDTNILLTVNIIKRRFDSNNIITSIDTIQAERYDYWFNDGKKEGRVRVAKHHTPRCAFTGHIPKEDITQERTVTIIKPTRPLQKIHIGCYEYKGTKEFIINNSNSNRFMLNIYHNYYWGGFIRNKKVLIKNNNKLLYSRNKNGKYYHDVWWDHHSKLKRKK